MRPTWRPQTGPRPSLSFMSKIRSGSGVLAQRTARRCAVASMAHRSIRPLPRSRLVSTLRRLWAITGKRGRPHSRKTRLRNIASLESPWASAGRSHRFVGQDGNIGPRRIAPTMLLATDQIPTRRFWRDIGAARSIAHWKAASAMMAVHRGATSRSHDRWPAAMRFDRHCHVDE